MQVSSMFTVYFIFRPSKANSWWFKSISCNRNKPKQCINTWQITTVFSILQICVWKQTFSPGKDEKYRLTFDWRFNTVSQSEIRVHWWTHNSKNLTYLGRGEFNSTLHQSSQGLATRVHGFSTKTKAPARKIPPATQAKSHLIAPPLSHAHSQW